jgi:tRNA(Ile)-lysidine synthetase-like protein
MAKILTPAYIIKLTKKTGYTCHKFDLIQPNDRILIGVSGGKDSLFLLEALADRVKHLPFRVELIASHIHLKEVGYKNDNKYTLDLCNNLNIKFVYDEISADLTADPKKAPCFVCSWHRRKRLFEIAKEYKCNKLALGHHMDDAIETLLMNMTFHGSISSMPAKLKMFDGRMELIRPLIELTNDELIAASEIRQYPKLKNQCPYGDNTNRTNMREVVNSLATMNKNARKNIFRSTDKIQSEYLPNGYRAIWDK